MLSLNDLGVLDHGHTAAIRHLAFYSDGFTAVVGELIVDRLVFPNDQIGFSFAYNADRAAASDALCPSGLAVLLAHRVMIDVAHHIDHLTGDFF